jgi:hypothetical protein
MRRERNVTLTEEDVRNSYKLLTGKPEWKGPFGIISNKQEKDSMVKHEGMDCICMLRA